MNLCNTCLNVCILGEKRISNIHIFPTSGFHKLKSQGPGLSWEEDKAGSWQRVQDDFFIEAGALLKVNNDGSVLCGSAHV